MPLRPFWLDDNACDSMDVQLVKQEFRMMVVDDHKIINENDIIFFFFAGVARMSLFSRLSTRRKRYKAEARALLAAANTGDKNALAEACFLLLIINNKLIVFCPATIIIRCRAFPT